MRRRPYTPGVRAAASRSSVIVYAPTARRRSRCSIVVAHRSLVAVRIAHFDYCRRKYALHVARFEADMLSTERRAAYCELDKHGRRAHPKTSSTCAARCSPAAVRKRVEIDSAHLDAPGPLNRHRPIRGFRDQANGRATTTATLSSHVCRPAAPENGLADEAPTLPTKTKAALAPGEKVVRFVRRGKNADHDRRRIYAFVRAGQQRSCSSPCIEILAPRSKPR